MKIFIYILIGLSLIACQKDNVIIGQVDQVITTPWVRGGNVLKYVISYENESRKDSTILIGNNIYKTNTTQPFLFQKGDSIVVKLSRISSLYQFNSFIKIHSLVERKKKMPIKTGTKEID